MASPLRILRYACTALKGFQRVDVTVSHSIHLSCATAKKSEPNSKPPPLTSKTGKGGNSEKDDLLDAASEVAASMKGLEDEILLDLSNQLAKLDSVIDERVAAQSVVTPAHRMAKVLSAPATEVPTLNKHAQKRVSDIKKIYKQTTPPPSDINVDKPVSKVVQTPTLNKHAQKRVSDIKKIYKQTTPPPPDTNVDKPVSNVVQTPTLNKHAQKRVSDIKKIYKQTTPPPPDTNVDKPVSNVVQTAKDYEKKSDSPFSRRDEPVRSETMAAEPSNTAGEVSPPNITKSTEDGGQVDVAELNEERIKKYAAARQQRSVWLDEKMSFGSEELERLGEEEGPGFARRTGKERKQDGEMRRGRKNDNQLHSKFDKKDKRYSDIPDGRISGPDLLSEVEAFNIFNPSKWTADNEAETIPMVQAWQDERDAELRNAQLFPHNGFEDMIRLTEEGKIWKYPIDNEQGMEEEKNTPFYEHVFLEKHLTVFPETGPVRRFMQLVATGLGKNPHLSVKEKIAHIQWFEDYFRQKQPLVTAEKLLADEPLVTKTVQT